MRALAATLTPLLLLGSLRAQEPGPAEMVARVFEETRPLAEALWREYQAASADERFSGQASKLPGWPIYVERVDEAAAIRFAADLVPNEESSRSGYGLLAMHVAMGWLHCEYLPKQQLVRLGSTQDPPDAEWDPYVRVVQLEDGTWRLASWPPARLEDLYSHREKFPDRLALTIDQEPDGFRLENRGATLADSRDPAPERWERFDRFLQDVVWPSNRIGERGESLDGVLIRVPAAAPVTSLLEVLARLGQPHRRIPDVQLWVTGGEFPNYYELDQRGAWGERPDVAPLFFGPDSSVAQAVLVAERYRLEHEEVIAFTLPWIGPGPDPAHFMHARTAEVMPILEEFWDAWSQKGDGNRVTRSPRDDEPGFRRMCERAAAVLTPHVSATLPRIAPELSREDLGQASIVMVAANAIPSEPSRWLTQGFEIGAAGTIARVAYRLPILSSMTPLPVAFLRLEDGDWKFCSWDRRDWEEEERMLAHQPRARAFTPTHDPVHLELRAIDERLRYKSSYELEVEGASLQELTEAFAAWVGEKYPHSNFSQSRASSLSSGAILLDAQWWAPQAALAPLLSLMHRPDCVLTELRIQVLLDGLGRPGEIVFDQSLARPGADATGASAVRLDPEGNLQQLCDRLDPLLVAGAERIHLLPPE
jgi:hypothetical protein